MGASPFCWIFGILFDPNSPPSVGLWGKPQD